MEILNDSGEYTFSNTNDEAWKRCEQIRQAARKALVEVDGRERLQRTVRARPRRALETLQFEESEFLSMCGDRSREEVKQKLDLASSSCRRATQFGSPGEVSCGSATKARSSRWATWKNKVLKPSPWSSSVPRRNYVFTQKNLDMSTWRARVSPDFLQCKTYHNKHSSCSLSDSRPTTTTYTGGLLKHPEDPPKD
jgi:hypothetical protein